MNTIRYFISDLDGCIADPFTPINWQLASQLRDLSDRSASDPRIPKLGICTGRPAPYTEAVSLWLNVQVPVLFESGVGMLDLPTQSIEFNPMLPNNAFEISRELKAFLVLVKERNPAINLESKFIDAGITCADTGLIQAILPEVQNFVGKNHPDLEVHHTDISINILCPQTNKGSGLRWFCEKHEIEPSQIAYIGDTSGDVPALKYAGLSFAPDNAHDSAKQAADITTHSSCTAGVIEAWEHIVNNQ